jgi:hypothetical protein
VRMVLEQHVTAEAPLPVDQQVWLRAILGMPRPESTVPETSDQRVRRYLEGVWPANGRGARAEDGVGEAGVSPTTHVELAAVARLLRHSNHSLHVYKPSAAEGCHCVQMYEPHESPYEPVLVRVANVPAGGAGVLNHWVAVVTLPPSDNGEQAAGSMSTRKASLRNAAGGLQDGKETVERSKRQRTGDV